MPSLPDSARGSIGLGLATDHRGGVRISDRRRIAQFVDVRHLVGHVLLQRPHGVRGVQRMAVREGDTDCSVRVTVIRHQSSSLSPVPAEACCLDDGRSLMSHYTLSTSRRSAAAEESDRISKDCGISMPMVTSASRMTSWTGLHERPSHNHECAECHGDFEKSPLGPCIVACCAAWFSV